MNTVVLILQIVVSVVLIIVVLMQSRGTSLGTAFGGGGESYQSKKGLEKILFYATIIAAAIFASVSIFSLVVS